MIHRPTRPYHTLADFDPSLALSSPIHPIQAVQTADLGFTASQNGQSVKVKT
jgi:hypothetical protein